VESNGRRNKRINMMLVGGVSMYQSTVGKQQ